MRTTRVLLIESARNNGVSFVVPLKRKYELHVAHSGKQGLGMAQKVHPDVIILDAISMRTSGDRICSRLRQSLKTLPIIHIRPKDSPKGESEADVVLQPPFTSRKLINRIERFAEMSDTGEVLDVGMFSLNLEQHMLVTPHNEKKLTPKLVDLMEMFMRQPNQTLARKDIMQKVWNTDYMGDTRTLDVHIRWLRKIVEVNPRKPEYITTVRGEGYCFMVPDVSATSGNGASENSVEASDVSSTEKETVSRASKTVKSHKPKRPASAKGEGTTEEQKVAASKLAKRHSRTNRLPASTKSADGKPEDGR